MTDDVPGSVLGLDPRVWVVLDRLIRPAFRSQDGRAARWRDNFGVAYSSIELACEHGLVEMHGRMVVATAEGMRLIEQLETLEALKKVDEPG